MGFLPPQGARGSNWTEQLLGTNESLSASWYLRHGDGEPVGYTSHSISDALLYPTAHSISNALLPARPMEGAPTLTGWMTPQVSQASLDSQPCLNNGGVRISPRIDSDTAQYVTNLQKENNALVRKNAALLENTGHLRRDVAMGIWHERDRALADVRTEARALLLAQERLKQESTLLSQHEEALATERRERQELEVELQNTRDAYARTNSRNTQLAQNYARLRADAEAYLASGGQQIPQKGAVDATHHYNELSALARDKEALLTEVAVERERNQWVELENRSLRQELGAAKQGRALVEADHVVGRDMLGAIHELKSLRQETQEVRQERERRRGEANRLLRVAEADLGRLRGERAACVTIMSGPPW